MPYDWRNYLEIAKALRTAGCEGSMRSGMSRAYYALYGCTLTFAKEIGLVTEKEIQNLLGKMHGELPRRLLSTDHEILSQVAMELKTLRERRNDADYNDESPDYSNDELLSDSILSVKEAFYKLEEY
jgi:hypothetical protein